MMKFSKMNQYPKNFTDRTIENNKNLNNSKKIQQNVLSEGLSI